MIVLFTDFGLHGPYTGQMKAVLHQMAPSTPVIDLFSDAPIGNPKASAYLLASYAAWFSAGTVFLCVVDPGVGGMRPAIILEADSRWYVGPGNGLFELVQRRAQQAHSWDINWKPERLSASRRNSIGRRQRRHCGFAGLRCPDAGSDTRYVAHRHQRVPQCVRCADADRCRWLRFAAARGILDDVRGHGRSPFRMMRWAPPAGSGLGMDLMAATRR